MEFISSIKEMHVDEEAIWDNTVIMKVESHLDGYWYWKLDGKAANYYSVNGNQGLMWKQNRVLISGKIMNRNIRSINGNIDRISRLKIIHWNGGGKRWENKLLEIECLIE